MNCPRPPIGLTGGGGGNDALWPFGPGAAPSVGTSSRRRISLIMPVVFHPRTSVEEVEEGTVLAPKFDENGLIPVVTTDYESGELLMHAYMNREALAKTIEIGEAVY